MSEVQESSRIFVFKKVEIIASWNPEERVDIAPIISDLDIFEHIDKPYLTGLMALEDTSNIFAGMGLGAGDRVEIILQRNDESKEIFLKRFFRIDKVVEKIRDGQNENSQVVLLHLVEEIAYESRYLNVNKSYSGTPYRIIKNILDTYCTDYTLYGPPFDVQDMQVIIPNMTPLDAACWIKNRATTADGYPFFLFSTIAHPLGSQKGLIMMDLDVMMKQKVWNDDMPYNNFASTQVERSVSARRTIKKFEHRSGEDFRKLLDKGLLGARHNYLDVTTMKPNVIDYDHDKEINQMLKEDGFEGMPLIGDYYEIHDTPIHKVKKEQHTVGNRAITQIGGTAAYKDKDSKGKTTLNERDSSALYKHKQISDSLKTLLSFDSIAAVIDGFDFAHNGQNTVGTIHQFMFMSTQPDPDTILEQFDVNLTGNYLIYAAKHSFKKEGYDVTLTATKLTHGEMKNDS